MSEDNREIDFLSPPVAMTEVSRQIAKYISEPTINIVNEHFTHNEGHSLIFKKQNMKKHRKEGFQ